MQKITPYLWFDTQAEEAAKFYISLFENSSIVNISYYGEGAPMPAGTVLTVAFQLNGQEFVALNGGPQFKFSEAVSFYVNCEDQQEVDRLWTALTKDGEEEPCGWLKDKFGLSWQIIPKGLVEMLTSPDQEKATRAMQCMFTMKKIDLAKIRQAYEQGGSISLEENLPDDLAQPALRALKDAGIQSLSQLTHYTEADIRKLHGIGPNALKLLRRSLADHGLGFRGS